MRFFFKNIFLFFLIFFFGGLVFSVEAASLKFDPSSINAASGANFDIKVVLDPGSDQVYSADIYINYDSTFLKVVNVKAESLFPTVSHDESTTGKIYIAAMENDPTSYVASSGAVVTITFQALKDGNSNLSFDCNNSKVVKNTNGTNVLVCSTSDNATITIGTGSDQSPTSAPVNDNNQLSELPKSGVFDNVIKFGLPGIILFIFGSALRLIL